MSIFHELGGFIGAGQQGSCPRSNCLFQQGSYGQMAFLMPTILQTMVGAFYMVPT